MEERHFLLALDGASASSVGEGESTRFDASKVRRRLRHVFLAKRQSSGKREKRTTSFTGGGEARTHDLRIAKQALSPLHQMPFGLPKLSSSFSS